MSNAMGGPTGRLFRTECGWPVMTPATMKSGNVHDTPLTPAQQATLLAVP